MKISIRFILSIVIGFLVFGAFLPANEFTNPLLFYFGKPILLGGAVFLFCILLCLLAEHLLGCLLESDRIHHRRFTLEKKGLATPQELAHKLWEEGDYGPGSDQH